MASALTHGKGLKEFNERSDYPFKIMDSKSVYCKVCEKLFLASQKCQVVQHVAREKHIKNSQLKRSKHQAQLEDMIQQQPKKSRSETMSKELCQAFLVSNIP